MFPVSISGIPNLIMRNTAVAARNLAAFAYSLRRRWPIPNTSTKPRNNETKMIKVEFFLGWIVIDIPG